jgi:hypothetical protein
MKWEIGKADEGMTLSLLQEIEEHRRKIKQNSEVTSEEM